MSSQTRINIGSDETGPLSGWGSKGGIFWGPYLFKYYKTEYKVQKNMGITLKKIIRGPKFFLARAPKFLNPALGPVSSCLKHVQQVFILIDYVTNNYFSYLCNQTTIFWTVTV